MGGPQFPWLSKKEAVYERGRSTVCMVYPGAYITPQPVWFTWLYFVILFSRCSASPRAAGLSLHAVQLCIFICSLSLSLYLSLSLCLTLSLLALAHARKTASKSVLGSAHEPEQQSFSSPQAVVFLNTRLEWKFVNTVMCQHTVLCPTDWINLHNYTVWPSVEIPSLNTSRVTKGFSNFSCQLTGNGSWLSLKE